MLTEMPLPYSFLYIKVRVRTELSNVVVLRSSTLPFATMVYTTCTSLSDEPYCIHASPVFSSNCPEEA